MSEGSIVGSVLGLEPSGRRFKSCPSDQDQVLTRGGAVAACRVHVPEVVGSIPTPAPKLIRREIVMFARRMTYDEENALNKLIPFAQLYANKNFNSISETDKWTLAFCEKMNELAIEEGLRISKKRILKAKE